MTRLYRSVIVLMSLVCASQASAAIVVFAPSSDWGDGYEASASIQIVNDEEEDLEDWVVSFDLATPITQFWDVNQESVMNEGGVWSYIFSAPSYASTISAGSSFTFGFNAVPSSPSVEITNGLVFADGGGLQPTPPPDESEYSLSSSIDSQWDSGANLTVSFTNSSRSTIKNWILGFEMDRSIRVYWNADLVVGDYGAQYAFAAPSTNKDLEPGETVTFGIEVGEGTDVPRDLRLLFANGTAVPEPQTYTLLAGFMVLAYVLTRRA